MSQYRYLLIPGRHHAITRFQIENMKQLLVLHPNATVVWAVTSANHHGTQRNPLSGTRRLGLVESVSLSESIPSQVYLIGNMNQKPDFAHYLIEDIRLQSNGRVDINPENTLVICSTPTVIAQYQKLNFSIDTSEIEADLTTIRSMRPWDIVEAIIASGQAWRDDATVRSYLHPVCFEYFNRYGLGEQIVETFQDPLIGSDDGDITATRDYATYRQAFEDGAKRKVADFRDAIQPGKILDVGCATGETLKVLSEIPDLFESDFYGVEAARPLYEICEQRKSNGEFANSNMFFYQRNIMRSTLFAGNSMNTVITMALTHEIESYLGRKELLDFIARMYEMTAPGGVYVNYDVMAPDDKDKMVLVEFTRDDGSNPDDVFPDISDDDLPRFLDSLSSEARFKRFAKDFRAVEGDTITYSHVTIDSKELIELRYADLCDFLAKKDYIDSWHSEMHERFCYWEYSDWVKALTTAGFEIMSGSERKSNPWLIENRFRPAAIVYCKNGDVLEQLENPITNGLLIARKPS